MQIVRKKLAADQVTPANIRYNPDCDCVEQTWDGGATWTPTPGADPRTSPAFRAPANASDAPQCNAAANMVSALRNLVDADVAADNALSLATLLLGTALLFVPVAGWIADAFLLVADAIILLDQATIEAAFTTTVYDDLLCTFFCRLDTDGQMSDEQLTAFLSDVFDNYDFTVYSVISQHSDTLGAVGWSNAGALGTGTGSDCSECDCGPWCYEWADAQIAGSGYWTFPFDGQGGQSVYVSRAFGAHLTKISFTYTSSMDCSGSDGAQIWDNPDFGGADIAHDIPTPSSPNTVTWDGDDDFPAGIGLGDVCEGGTVTLTLIHLEGTGARPFLDGGTDCS